ncbi:MAG: SpvB/TcaC N-terminal domain-containing protein [Pseudomonadota bacterium]
MSHVARYRIDRLVSRLGIAGLALAAGVGITLGSVGTVAWGQELSQGTAEVDSGRMAAASPDKTSDSDPTKGTEPFIGKGVDPAKTAAEPESVAAIKEQKFDLEEKLGSGGAARSSAASSGGGGSGGGSGGATSTSPGAALMNFQTNSFTGAFSFSVPIVVPPARQGTEPSITLGYNSRGGNSWCGVGWNLDMGFIQREGREGVPIKWDTTVSPNVALDEYDDDKGFFVAFGGVQARLTKITDPDTNDSYEEYRAEVDQSFMRFLYDSAANLWLVIDRNGNKYFFGDQPICRMTNDRFTTAGTTGSAAVFRWSICKTEDPNGNTVYFNYTMDGNQQYLSSITYNSSTKGGGVAGTHRVDFILEDRPDDTFSYNAGYKIETKKRLKEIKVQITNLVDPLVRKYIIDYTQSPSTLRSLITTITEYGEDGVTSLPSMTFDYQELQAGFDDVIDWGPLQSMGYTNHEWRGLSGYWWDSVWGTVTHHQLTDVNRDGLPDRVMQRYPAPHDEWLVQYNNGSGFDAEQVWTSIASQPGQNPAHDFAWNAINGSNNTGPYATLQDINNDSLPDRVLREYALGSSSAPYPNHWVQFNDGQTLQSGTTYGPISDQGTGDNNWQFVGRSDIGSFAVQLTLQDINGDGLPDRVMRKNASPYDKFIIQFNTGTGFGPDVAWDGVDSPYTTSNPQWCSPMGTAGDQGTFAHLTDINGDGLPDRVMRQEPGAPHDVFKVQYNNGSGFEPMQDWGPVTSTTASHIWRNPRGQIQVGSQSITVATLADINGDGLADRILRKDGAPFDRFKVQFNTGTGFAAEIDWPFTPYNNGSDWYFNSISASAEKVSDAELMDINGDGILDRVIKDHTAPHDNLKVQLGKGDTPDLLSAFQNGIGGEVRVTYKASTELNNEDHNGVGQLGHNVYVVNDVTVDDGMGMNNSTSTTSYAYSGGYFDYAS